ncbi:MAG: hypothetical protein ACOCQR_03825 [bacterium]
MDKFVHFGERFDILKFKEVENRKMPHSKPDYGFWASPYTPDTEYVSHWAKWCEQEGFGDCTNGFVFELSDSNIYVINSRKDLLSFIEEVGAQKYPTELEERWREMDLPLDQYPDFEKAAQLYDAVYLTEKGLRETKSPVSCPNLYSWDVESILIFNPHIIKEIRPLP